MSWFLGCFKKYAVFQGRARRKEFWMFTLFYLIFSFGLAIFDSLSGLTFPVGNDVYFETLNLTIEAREQGILSLLFSLAIFIPSLAVSVRRLHDIGKSGWWILINLIFICAIGPIWFIVLMCKEGTHGENEYGPDPKDPNPTNEFIPT